MKTHIYEATLPEGVKRNVTVLNVACEIRWKRNDKRKEKKRMTQREREKFVTCLRILRPVTSGTRSLKNLAEPTESELKMWSALQIRFQNDWRDKGCDPGWQRIVINGLENLIQTLSPASVRQRTLQIF